MAQAVSSADAELEQKLVGYVCAGLIVLMAVFGYKVARRIWKAVRMIRRGPSEHRRLAELYDFASRLPRTTIFHKGIIRSGLTATVYDPETGLERNLAFPAHLEATKVHDFGGEPKAGPTTADEFLGILLKRRDESASDWKSGIGILALHIPWLILVESSIAFLIVKIIAAVSY